LIRELAQTVPSEAELEEAVRKVTDLRVQELRQRNEQFMHPLSKAEMERLERAFRESHTEAIPLFSAMEVS
jgi:hypothetical protein